MRALVNLLTTCVMKSVSGTNVGKTLNRALISSCFNRLSSADRTSVNVREKILFSRPVINQVLLPS